MLTRWTACFLIAAAAAPGCGGGSEGGPGGGESFQCESVPACHMEALAALEACVPEPVLALGEVTPMSGVVDGLTCESGDVVVQFSAFSDDPTDQIAVPSNVTILRGGELCAELGSGNGTSTDGSGNVRAFDLSILDTPETGEIAVYKYEDGAFGVNCSPPAGSQEVVAPAGALDDCPGAVLFHEVVRDEEITQIDVDLLDVTGARTRLFSCQ